MDHNLIHHYVMKFTRIWGSVRRYAFDESLRWLPAGGTLSPVLSSRAVLCSRVTKSCSLRLSAQSTRAYLPEAHCCLDSHTGSSSA